MLESERILFDSFISHMMFSSAFNIKSSVVAATALIASVSLVLGRPQARQLEARDWTDGLNLNSDANPNTFTLPSPSEFLLSSSDGSSPPLIGSLNLGFVAPEKLSAVPSDPLGLSTDWTKTPSPPVGGESDVAFLWPGFKLSPNERPSPNVESDPANPMVVATEAVKRSIDSITHGYFTYGFFKVSPDRKYLTPTEMYNNNDLDTFIAAVRNAPPSYALRLAHDPAAKRKQMLLIFTYQNNRNGLGDETTALLDDHFKEFLQFVEAICGKTVDATQVYDEDSLKNAIKPYYP